MLTRDEPLSDSIATKGLALRVTIDSSESLSDTLRVLGALYDVKIVVADEDATAVSTQPAGSGSASPSHEVRVRRAKEKLAAEPEATLNNGVIRSWALENGWVVSNRGRLPARVVAAYRDAHQL